MSLDNTYSFEIDFLPVGDGERSGDAIAIRYGYPSDFRVVVVDGGDQDAGERLVRHVRTVYQADHIDLAVNTHPDSDHASGLRVVMENIPVRRLWMHQPWNHPAEAKPLFRDGRFTTAGLSDRLREAVDAAHALHEAARANGVPVIEEPFQGLDFGPLAVMSPTCSMYLELIPHFDSTPAPKRPSPVGALGLDALENGIGLAAQGALGLRGGLLGLGLGALEPRPASTILGSGLRPRGLINSAMADLGIGLSPPPKRRSQYETWTSESLADDVTTSAQNESSVVLYGRFNGQSILLTGDAGRGALSTAWLYATQLNIDLRRCGYYQVPHHGSRHNVSPRLLEMLLGARSPTPIVATRYAIASVAAGALGYPRKSVSNAFKRRGVSVCRTAGKMLTVQSGMFPNRMGAPAAQLPFYDVVDDPDE